MLHPSSLVRLWLCFTTGATAINNGRPSGKLMERAKGQAAAGARETDEDRQAVAGQSDNLVYAQYFRACGWGWVTAALVSRHFLE
jgi:hypothetical protein